VRRPIVKASDNEKLLPVIAFRHSRVKGGSMVIIRQTGRQSRKTNQPSISHLPRHFHGENGLVMGGRPKYPGEFIRTPDWIVPVADTQVSNNSDQTAGDRDLWVSHP